MKHSSHIGYSGINPVYISGTESFCTRDKSEYFASRITLATANYPELSPLAHCVCLISMDTDSTVHLKLHVQSRDREVTWCQPEIRLGYDDAVTSVCPTMTSNYSLHYEMRRGRQVNVIVINDEKEYFRAVIMIQGAQGGLIAGVVVVVIAVIVLIIMVSKKIGCSKLKTHIMRQTVTTSMSTTSEKKIRTHSGPGTKNVDSTAVQTQYLLNGKPLAERSGKRNLDSTYDDLDSRSYKGRDYYIDRGYKITITSASGDVRRWDDPNGVELYTFGSRAPSRSPSFQYMEKPYIPKRSPSIHSNIETNYRIDLDGSTPRLGRNAILSRNLLPRNPINLYRVDFPVQGKCGQATRHSAPSIVVTGVKTTAVPSIEVAKTPIAPVFSLNDDDICFEGE
ncbi:hypothetical protein LSH36_696g01100 [Paralvinella palmiformis]|uniref:Uncharacterized protein n=1 Tax=Paralvinella palmiformis TaxID=53620 RepID=A0AAD9J3B0_9ANNE|nr:hypothetical protein LSH36_696g01100 [Paralvinella palmiformis]